MGSTTGRGDKWTELSITSPGLPFKVLQVELLKEDVSSSVP